MDRRALFSSRGSFCPLLAAGCGGGTENSGSDFVLRNIQPDEQPVPLRVTIELLESSLSHDIAPIIEIALQNRGHEVYQQSGPSSQSPPWLQPNVEPRQLTFIPAETIPGALLDALGCARIEGVVHTADGRLRTIKSGETISQEYAIVPVDAWIDGVCPEPGTYRAEANVGFTRPWGFDFELIQV